jgi:myo-inositol 2-dehydrogenase / D-chiro-inositol 1-dehydrogenase
MPARTAAPPPADPVRVGLLGLGAIAARHHLPELLRAEGATLVAVADPDPAARARARRLAGVCAYEHPGAILARPDVDAVVITAPTNRHAELAVGAAEAGKHLYLEKPVATDAREAVRVEDAVRRAGVLAAVGFNRRLHPLYEQARSLVARGRIGRVRAVHSAFCEPVPPAAMPEWKRRRATGGGVLLDLGSHHVDLVRWLLDDEVASASASCASELSEQDTAWVRLEMRGGARVQGVYSFRAGYADHLELIGERGTLRIDRHRPVIDLRLHRRRGYGIRPVLLPPTPAVAAWRLRRLAGRGGEPSYGRSLGAFLGLVRGGASGGATLEDGLRSLEAVLAAEGSACASS